jgi:hypothetical protein
MALLFGETCGSAPHDEGVSVEARIRHLWFESPQRYKNNDSRYPISPLRRYRVKWSEYLFYRNDIARSD